MITIIIGPSASGKDTLMKSMLKKDRSLSPVVSYTTRPIRNGETNGVDYHFVSKDAFCKLDAEGKILESRQYDTLVNGVPDVWYYGSPKVDAAKDYVVVLDPDGARKWLSVYGAHNVSVIALLCPEEVRRHRAMQRGSFDQLEWERRAKDDAVKFAPEVFDRMEKDFYMEIRKIHNY